jgi:hypothetical protein
MRSLRADPIRSGLSQQPLGGIRRFDEDLGAAPVAGLVGFGCLKVQLPHDRDAVATQEFEGGFFVENAVELAQVSALLAPPRDREGPGDNHSVANGGTLAITRIRSEKSNVFKIDG